MYVIKNKESNVQKNKNNVIEIDRDSYQTNRRDFFQE